MTFNEWYVQQPHLGVRLFLLEECWKAAQENREWVELTNEEIDELHGSPMSLEHSGELKWVRIIEAKLKEKNT